jgi:phage tail-like protein
MSESLANDDFAAPWFGARFQVDFSLAAIPEPDGGASSTTAEPLCKGAFAEVSGLEASMEPRTIKEGGANYGVHQRAGQVNFATVVLKRGMTEARDLWNWWALFSGAGSVDGRSRSNGAFAHRLTVRITLMALDGTPQLKWRLDRAMPVKFKAADFNARATEVAIEELHFAHEGLFFEALAGGS